MLHSEERLICSYLEFEELAVQSLSFCEVLPERLDYLSRFQAALGYPLQTTGVFPFPSPSRPGLQLLSLQSFQAVKKQTSATPFRVFEHPQSENPSAVFTSLGSHPPLKTDLGNLHRLFGSLLPLTKCF